ncbi:hypothetical protein NPX13_g818 [Xylaria arbuscula]|uniref:Uncharacterized protein n=1 Tax=Xylaria arbuscula TaxID=114810 RepID=A0A9W8TQ66_9PEZI|nr:hypothetical protein NPX13_g818 [Xylaria arbuscula]
MKAATDLPGIRNTSSLKTYEELMSRAELWNWLGLHADNADIPIDAPSWPTCLPAAPVAVPEWSLERLRIYIFSFSVQQAPAALSNGED